MPFAQYSNTAAAFAYDPSSTHTTVSPQPEPSTPEADPVGAARAEQAALLRVAISTITHFFGPLSSFMTRLRDPRDPDKITYPLPALLFAGLLLFLCRLGSRRQVTHLLRQGVSNANFHALFGVETCPHGDTLNEAFCRLQPDEMQEEVSSLVETLIRKKVLSPYRLLGRFYIVAIDGTQIYTFHTRHCTHCLTRTTRDGQTFYYHNVLEAKLVTPAGFSFSLMSEFIENPAPHPTKQDCELKAFYRLAHRLKERFPRLPLLLSMDGLFAGGPTFTLCQQCGWKFMIVLKDDDLPSVNQEFAALKALTPGDKLRFRTGRHLEITQLYQWVNSITYVDSDHQPHALSVLECRETKPGEESLKTTKFKWITNLHLTAQNAQELAEHGGRIRWKIENEGFNAQKNDGFALEHAYSQNETAAKVFYFLLQIAHLLFQLIERGSLLKQVLRDGCGSAKNLALRLLEAWRNCLIHTNVIDLLNHRRFQIRFDTS
jgi:DDE family transposase